MSTDSNSAAAMVMDMITGVLAHHDNIMETGVRLSREIRRMTGAHMVILVALDENAEGSHEQRILAVDPSRHKKILKTGFMKNLIAESVNARRAAILDPEEYITGHDVPSDGVPFLPCMVIPLRAGHGQEGAILSLGLMNMDCASSILEMHEILSRTVSVIVKSALLAEKNQRLQQKLKQETAVKIIAQEELREIRQKFQDILETLYDITWEVDSRGIYTYISPQVKTILGYEPDEILGKSPSDLMPPDEADRIWAIFTRALDEKKPVFSLENINLHRDGHPVVLETNGMPFFDSRGNLKGFRGTDRDITARRRIEEELHRSQEKFSNILMTSPYGIVITDLKDGRFVEVSESFLSQMGYSREDVINRTTTDLNIWVNPGDRDDIIGDLREGRQVYSRECLFRKKNDQIITGLYSGMITRLNGETYLLSSVNDITERKKDEDIIRHLATHDPLTDLPGLRLVRDRLSMAMNRSLRQRDKTAVMFIDLDGFKAVNDTMGHDAGDHVLKEIARRLQSSLRQTDTVARLGGDEFLVISTGLHSAEDATCIARNIIDSVTIPVIFDGRNISIGTSIGISIYPDDGIDMDVLIKKADKAMYRVKKWGKNNFTFTGSSDC